MVLLWCCYGGCYGVARWLLLCCYCVARLLLWLFRHCCGGGVTMVLLVCCYGVARCC